MVCSYSNQPSKLMEGGVPAAVSAVLSALEEKRRAAYSRSSIALVSCVENKYPLADIIMKRWVRAN